MKSLLLAAGAAFALSACASNSNQPTFWGKEGVTMLDYRTDGGQCAVIAATADTMSNGAHTAGGVSGQSVARLPPPAERQGGASAAPPGAIAPPASGAAFPTGGTGTNYRDDTAPEIVNRTATQEQTQEMAAQKARTEQLKSCLAGRGYTEFSLTTEQRAHLATLPQGSDARREYLYKLGTDPNVLKSQAVNR